MSRPPGRLQARVELELPVVAAESDPRAELADVRLDILAAGHPHDQLGVRAAGQRRVHRRRERAAEPGVDVGDSQADLRISEHLDRAGAADAQGLAHAGAELDQLRVLDHRSLDRLAAA